jgi:chaperonin cofactor prefoldin
MQIDVDANDVVTLLSERIGQMVVEIDTHRLAMTKLQEGSEILANMVNTLNAQAKELTDKAEALQNKIASYQNLVRSLETQIVDLGETPVSYSLVIPEGDDKQVGLFDQTEAFDARD